MKMNNFDIFLHILAAPINDDSKVDDYEDDVTITDDYEGN